MANAKPKDKTPMAAERSQMQAKLRALGLPASVVASIVSNGKRRDQIVADLIAYGRALPPTR